MKSFMHLLIGYTGQEITSLIEQNGEVNVSDISSQDDLNNRVRIASFFGTLQAGFTDLHYLRDIWRKTTEKDALIGVGMTGIASGQILKCNLHEAAEVVKEENKRVAKIININCAARCTTIKPSGTTSCVLGTSSGIHAWHNDYYIRRIRIMKNDSLYTYLMINHPELIEDDKLRSHDTAIISIPQKAPEGSILRTETALDLLERVKKFNVEWVKGGHNKGDNTNNVSATVSIDKNRLYTMEQLEPGFNEQQIREWRESFPYDGYVGDGVTVDDMIKGLDRPAIEEWTAVGEWMWENKDTFNGLSVLPYDNGSYVQAPFENCTKEVYEEMMKSLKDIDLTGVVEIDDNTSHSQEAACAGGQCSI